MGFSLFRPRNSTPRQMRLRTLDLFADLAPAEIAIVDGLLHERSYLKDEVIFDAGDEGQALYIVVAGEVLICAQGEPESGRIAVLGPGSFFGELALLDGGPRSAQARAAAACELTVFFRADFMSLLETDTGIASKVTRQLARHIGTRMRSMVLAAGAYQHM